jgi:hypothetical protein
MRGVGCGERQQFLCDIQKREKRREKKRRKEMK